MKIVIGIIVVLGLGWLLLGAGGEEAAAPDAPAVEEAVEGEAMMEEGEAMMEEGEGHSDGAVMEEDEAMMAEEGAGTASEGEAVMEEEAPVAQ